MAPAQEASKEGKVKPEPVPKASLSQLYAFASRPQKAMLGVAFLTSGIAGLCQPMMLLAFKDMFKSLSSSASIGGALFPSSLITRVLTTMTVLASVLGVSDFIAAGLTEYVVASIMSGYKQAYLKAVLRQDVGWYDISNPEELSVQFSDATVKVQKGLKQTRMIFLGFGYGTGGLVMAFLPSFGHPLVAAVTVATVPLLIVSAGVMMYFVENGAKLVSKAYGHAGGIATESLYAMRTVASLGIERVVSERYQGALSSVRRVSIAQTTAFMCTASVALASYLVMMAVAVIFGAYQLADEIEESAFSWVVPSPLLQSSVYYCADLAGQLTNISIGAPCVRPFNMSCSLADTVDRAGATPLSLLADFTGPGAQADENSTLLETLGFQTVDAFAAFVRTAGPASYLEGNADYYSCSYSGEGILLAVFAVMFMGEGYGMAGQPAQHLSLARESAARILAVIHRVPAIDSFSDAGAKPADVRGAIELTDVVFAFPSAPEHAVCKGYSLTIPAGQTVALCGPSGAGKSTIIQLIERFYDPQSGSVLLDGADLKTLNVRWLRAQIGLVGQEPVLFQGSVAQNIKYGKPGGEATQDEVEEAARMANAHGFITANLANGYEADVGLKGGKLSGGQKQRVAIARALIKRPAILLLDEATSALDNESEGIVQAALDEILKTQRRTTVVIAHRLSTIRGADKIAVVSEGRILEQGTHDDLLSLRGMYTSLVIGS